MMTLFLCAVASLCCQPSTATAQMSGADAVQSLPLIAQMEETAFSDQKRVQAGPVSKVNQLLAKRSALTVLETKSVGGEINTQGSTVRVFTFSLFEPGRGGRPLRGIMLELKTTLGGSSASIYAYVEEQELSGLIRALEYMVDHKGTTDSSNDKTTFKYLSYGGFTVGLEVSGQTTDAYMQVEGYESSRAYQSKAKAIDMLTEMRILAGKARQTLANK